MQADGAEVLWEDGREDLEGTGEVLHDADVRVLLGVGLGELHHLAVGDLEAARVLAAEVGQLLALEGALTVLAVLVVREDALVEG